MNLRKILVFFILTKPLILRKNIWNTNLKTNPERVISNTPTATFNLFSKKVLVEGSPTGNAISGLGKVTPIIAIPSRLGTITSQNQSFFISTSTQP